MQKPSLTVRILFYHWKINGYVTKILITFLQKTASINLYIDPPILLTLYIIAYHSFFLQQSSGIFYLGKSISNTRKATR